VLVVNSSLNSLTIRIGLVARICRSHSSVKKTRTDKAGVQFPDSESMIVSFAVGPAVVEGRCWFKAVGDFRFFR
jgi:hypothetical protein